VAAIRAAQLGKKVVLIEREHLGGICLNWGCIPTKALLKSSEILHTIQKAKEFGINVSGVTIDIKKMIERSRSVASQLSGGIKALLNKNKVEAIMGEARLKSKSEIEVKSGSSKSIVKAKNIIVATGARAKVLKNYEPDGKQVWTYKEAMVPTSMPKSLIIVGSGAIGIEFASFYKTLGVDVTIIEAADRILPVEDEEISSLALKSFEKDGMKFKLGAKLGLLSKSKDAVSLEVESKGKKEVLKAEKLIMAVGIVANTENIGLENTKIKLDRNHIVTDKFCMTGEQGVYAIGDVTAGPWLAHKASHEGIVAVDHMFGKKPHPINLKNIPGCTYSRPQIASVGMTEIEAKKERKNIKVGRFPFIGNGKAIALGEPEGLIKTIFDAKTGELLGAHMIGAEVTELIQGYVIAKQLETTEQELIETIFPHPTLSEMMHESVLDAFDRAVHM
jgi:dihydrolipoamide dehydrogenase